MTEKEKMLAGLLYNSRDPELLEMYFTAKELQQAYNQLAPRAVDQRMKLLKQLLRKVEAGVWIEAPFFCDYGKLISIGANTFVNTNCIFLDNNNIKIGENCLIGPYVQIYTAGHPLNAKERIIAKPKPGGATYKTRTRPVNIGDNVWIGGNSSIMPGISIGDNTTIGAGSVVTKNIPANVLAFGNPCKIIEEI